MAPTLRPSSPASPIATLKKSIAAFEDNIIEVTNQQRRVRKDSKTNAATLRKEIDMLKERESKYANADDKLQSRHLQHTQHIRQADDSMTAITEELEFYETVPEDETRKWSEQRASWEAIRKEQTQAREDLYRTKEQNTRVHTSAQADYLSAGQKRERLQHRVTRLTNQHNNMLSSSPSAPLEQLRSNSDQSTKHNGRYQIEYNYQESINQLNRNYQDATYRLRSVTEHCNALKHAAEQASFQALVQNRQHISGSRPITPEGELPGTYPVPSSVGSTSLSRYAPYGSPEPHQMSIANGYGNGNATVHLRDSNNRARSASVLSGNSLYEDFDDEEFLPVIAGRFGGMVKEGSDGSGESGSGNASPHLKYRRTTSRT